METPNSTKEYRVIIPEEDYQVFKFLQEDWVGIALVNANLKNFEPKKVFAWHCSVMIELEQTGDNRLPISSESEILGDFCDWLDIEIKGENKQKPNALFLASITWNQTREMIWRVFDPEITNQFLMDLIAEKKYARPFDFRIEHDEDWKLATWHLKNC